MFKHYLFVVPGLINLWPSEYQQVLSVYNIGYQQGIIDYSRDPMKMELSLLDTILAGVGCISSDDRDGVLVAREGEWRNILERFRSTHSESEHDDEYTRVLMLRNISIVGDEGVVYRCPLTPCSWTCGKDGMRTGKPWFPLKLYLFLLIYLNLQVQQSSTSSRCTKYSL